MKISLENERKKNESFLRSIKNIAFYLSQFSYRLKRLFISKHLNPLNIKINQCNLIFE